MTKGLVESAVEVETGAHRQRAPLHRLGCTWVLAQLPDEEPSGVLGAQLRENLLAMVELCRGTCKANPPGDLGGEEVWVGGLAAGLLGTRAKSPPEAARRRQREELTSHPPAGPSGVSAMAQY